ncbi:MAG: glutamate 5-kinase [Bacillota bacterium]
MRFVVKVGSSSLTAADGTLSPQKMLPLVVGIARLRLAGQQVALVSSGAVASGYQLAGFKERPTCLVEKQAAAAVGQSQLIDAYHQYLMPYGLSTAQLLLTAEDLADPARSQNARNVLRYLLRQPIIPIINENDTVAVEELTFGDSDQLSALVAGEIEADGLVILTDTDGLYDKNPSLYADARRIQRVSHWDADLLQLATGGSKLGTGGMRSKLQAAARALGWGIPCFIGKVTSPEDFLAIFRGRGHGTYLGPDELVETAYTCLDHQPTAS